MKESLKRGVALALALVVTVGLVPMGIAQGNEVAAKDRSATVLGNNLSADATDATDATTENPADAVPPSTTDASTTTTDATTATTDTITNATTDQTTDQTTNPTTSMLPAATGIYPVASAADLTTALASSESTLVIELTSSFSNTRSIVIPAGKTVLLRSAGGFPSDIKTLASAIATAPSGLALIQVDGTLALENITLTGSSLTTALVHLRPGGALTVGSGATLCDNVYTGVASAAAGAVYIDNDASCLMQAGAQITRVSAVGNSWAAVYNRGSFTMTGGEIHHNTDSLGVRNDQGASTVMTGGAVHHNTTQRANAFGAGAGIYNRGILSLSGTAAVHDNIAYTVGGGIMNNGTLALSENASVYGNFAPLAGGGIYNTGTLAVTGAAQVHHNSTEFGDGGGLWIDSVSVAIAGSASIHHNSAGDRGGGIYITGNSLMLSDTVRIYANEARTIGGGLCLTNVTFVARGQAEISGNIAGTNGGGINASGGSLSLLGNSKVSDNLTEFSTLGVALGSGCGAGIYLISCAALLDENASVVGNRAQSIGGGLCAGPDTTLIVQGAVRIANNAADNTGASGAAGFGGGIGSHNATIIVQGDAVIAGNSASTQGGGIHGNATNTIVTVRGNVLVTDNTSENGGGIASWYSASLNLGGNVKLSSNTAETFGGGIYAAYGPAVNLRDKVQVCDNTAKSGGGIYGNAYSTISLEGSARVSGNTATKDGGGIFMPYDQLAKLEVARGVVFADNTAQALYGIKPVDVAVHVAHVLTRSFSLAQPWGYNNYDIAYYNPPALPTVFWNVSFVDGFGTTLSTQSVVDGGDAVAPSNPTRASYVFLGWDLAYTNITGHLTVTARWQPVPTIETPEIVALTYGVFYVGGAPEVRGLPGGGQFVAGATVTIGAAPEREGYRFTNWLSSAGGTYAPADVFVMPARAVVLTALWEQAPSTPVTPPVAPTIPAPSEPIVPDEEPAAPAVQMTPDQAKFAAQTGNVLTDILNGNVPLGSFTYAGAWSLLSLIMVSFGLLSSLACIIGRIVAFGRRAQDGTTLTDEAEHDRRKKRRMVLALTATSVFAAGAALLVWLLLDTMSQPMVWVNHTTLIVFIIIVIHSILAVLGLLVAQSDDYEADSLLDEPAVSIAY